MSILTPRVPSVRERLDHLLERAIRETGSKGIAIARRDGLPIAHLIPGAQDARMASAMCASILGSVAAVAVQLDQGDVNHLIVDCSQGKILAVQAGPEAAVLAWCNRDANVGLALIRLREAARGIADALGEG